MTDEPLPRKVARAERASWIRPGTLLTLYAGRLRRQWLQELLAAAGIATGVMLVFGVLAANTSIKSSAREIANGIAGRAQLQLRAIGAEGFDARIAERVRTAPGVQTAAALLQTHATLRYGDRQVGIDLVGLDNAYTQLGGVTSRPAMFGLFRLPGIYLSAGAGDALGIRVGSAPAQPVTIAVRGRARHVPVIGVLGHSEIGALGDTLISSTSLQRAQRLSGLPDRATRILVVARAGQEDVARRSIEQIARTDGLQTSTVDDELHALAVATAPNDQSTTLFAAIAAIVGLLLTGMAMLLTVPERRRELARMRIVAGFTARQAAQVLMSQALLLGLLASGVGVIAGYLIARSSAQAPPGYLAFAFPLGSGVDVQPWMVVAAIAGGTMCTCIAAATPLMDLHGGRALNAIFGTASFPGQSISAVVRLRLALAAGVLVLLASAMVALWPATTLLAVGALIVATLLAMPAIVAAILAVADQLERIDRAPPLVIPIGALRAAPVRSLALAATCAVAVCGALAIGGARDDLLHGLDQGEYYGTADIWISQQGDALGLEPFRSPAGIDSIPGVAAVRRYTGGLLDIGDRRSWVVAHSIEDSMMVPPSQVLDGNYATANARLRAGGWVTVSDRIAREQGGISPGATIELPTPTGRHPFRVAAITTNLGWGPGAIAMNADDYRRAWASDAPTALEVDVRPGASPTRVAAEIRAALGPTTGLEVKTTPQAIADAAGIVRDGLARLRQISTLLLIAAAAAIAVAMTATIRDRRPQLAAYAIEGWSRAALWRALMAETAMILLAGCLAGTAAGTYGHYLGGRWLQQTTSFPAPWSWSFGAVLPVCALLAGVALLVTAVPGWFAAQPRGRLAIERR
ncbi:MAG TPA: FtsX-like permease family protein [Conexibacter sp.]|jgi:putative ABC transport system permease protein|nr:FtsX-like permease family protein [Conexibacter sp.]